MLGAGRGYGDGGPRGGRGDGVEDLEAGLPAQAEEQGYGAVVGVCAGADVGALKGGGAGWWGVVEESEDGAGGEVGSVRGAEEGGGVDLCRWVSEGTWAWIR